MNRTSVRTSIPALQTRVQGMPRGNQTTQLLSQVPHVAAVTGNDASKYTNLSGDAPPIVLENGKISACAAKARERYSSANLVHAQQR